MFETLVAVLAVAGGIALPLYLFRELAKERERRAQQRVIGEKPVPRDS